MGQRFTHDARKWLRSNPNNYIHDRAKGIEHGPALVEDLYRANAVKVEVGTALETGGVADTLFVTLPADREEAIKVMALLAWQHGDEVDLVDGVKDVVRIWWD